MYAGSVLWGSETVKLRALGGRVPYLACAWVGAGAAGHNHTRQQCLSSHTAALQIPTAVASCIISTNKSSLKIFNFYNFLSNCYLCSVLCSYLILPSVGTPDVYPNVHLGLPAVMLVLHDLHGTSTLR